MTSSKVKNIMAGIYFNQTSQIPSELWLGLSTTTINTDGGGATEPDASTGYMRYKIPNSSPDYWDMAANGIVKSAKDIKFSEIKTDAGEATYWFIAESQSGTPVIWKQFVNANGDPSPKRLGDNTIITINKGDLQISVSDK